MSAPLQIQEKQKVIFVHCEFRIQSNKLFFVLEQGRAHQGHCHMAPCAVNELSVVLNQWAPNGQLWHQTCWDNMWKHRRCWRKIMLKPPVASTRQQISPHLFPRHPAPPSPHIMKHSDAHLHDAFLTSLRWTNVSRCPAKQKISHHTLNWLRHSDLMWVNRAFCR